MTIFFTASIRGYKKLKNNYDLILKIIKNLNHKYIGNYPFIVTTDQVYSYNQNENLELFNSMNRFMKNCNIMILEVSEHSVSMGYMIMKVLSMKKPVIALHTKNNNPAFLEGIEDENFQLIEYDSINVKKIIIEAISYSKSNNTSRFNLLLNPELTTYIEDTSKQENISKAAFIRQLIKSHKRKT
jgi:hypothetical protein